MTWNQIKLRTEPHEIVKCGRCNTADKVTIRTGKSVTYGYTYWYYWCDNCKRAIPFEEFLEG